MMVKLDATIDGDDCGNPAVIISLNSFEHLLNCLDNQKYVHEVNADAIGTMSTKDIRATQADTQSKIDDFNRQCRTLLNSYEGGE